ncbi:MAG: type II toxin-antitoxin system antitoxin, RelB/DinJ family [Candidatus Marinimicrobia bacterium CG_4_10_14_0_2_um_filter_48_9]|nr:MAG: type II toxin-antitoxin system antitoxin, RelB/DinJ family [Candidatus Marinimicrobia bacterium CG_4_10_14_0_2_um_filter_48_9]
MSKSTTVRAMMDPKKKEKVNNILGRLGLNHSEAINIYYSLIEEYKGLPFPLTLPDSGSETETTTELRPEVLKHLKRSVRKNHRLGELLAQ